MQFGFRIPAVARILASRPSVTFAHGSHRNQRFACCACRRKFDVKPRQAKIRHLRAGLLRVGQLRDGQPGTGVDQEQAKKLVERVEKVMSAKELKPYLNADQWVAAWNELDIASEEGKSYRMDRLVEFEIGRAHV